MWKVSDAYRESMKSPLRERSYIMLTFGLFNKEAQASATLDGEFTYYSTGESVFAGRSDDVDYATLEADFAKVDGSMMLPPPPSSYQPLYDTGLVGKTLVTDGGLSYSLDVNLNIGITSFKGMMIDFGENYPVRFDISSDAGQVMEVRDNDSETWSTDESFDGLERLTITAFAMKKPQTRLRIRSLTFGRGLSFSNEDVIDSTLETYVSPIAEDVPQIDFSVTLKNYDHYFNLDNPKSLINYLETGQEMDIMYGYQLPGSQAIEWIQGGHLLCSEWESDDSTATIRCQDVFRNMEAEYVRGTVSTAGTSFYSIAEDILRDAGIESYYIDPQLKTIGTYNPVPRVTHKEALQMVANACRCTLSQSRTGEIQIRLNVSSEAAAYSNGEVPFSKVGNIMAPGPKDEYAMLTEDYVTVSGEMFMPPQKGAATRNTGYVSSEMSDAKGVFANKPKVSVRVRGSRTYRGIKLTFGSVLPSRFTVRASLDGTAADEVRVGAGEIGRVTTVTHDFWDCNLIEVEFDGTAVPYNRIVLAGLELDDAAVFTMTKEDMTSAPRLTRQEVVKEIVVPWYGYVLGTQEESLYSEEIQVESGETVTYYMQDPSVPTKILLDGKEGGIEKAEWGHFYITLRFSTEGKHKLEIMGKKYSVVERQIARTLHERGNTVKWENPLVAERQTAERLADWLADYYEAGAEYEYETRGNPELDASDIICQENEFYEDMKVCVIRHTVGFGQALSGNVTTRRIGG